MSGSSIMKRGGVGGGGRAAPGSRLARVSDDLKRHILENHPVRLDGALGRIVSCRGIGRRAPWRPAEGEDPAGRPLAGAAFRAALDAIAAVPRPATAAGLIPVSPRRMRVWWDAALMEPPEGDIVAGIDGPRPVLRFYDVTGLPPGANGWNHVFDIDVDFAEYGKTVDFWAADRVYRVEVGMACADGRFLCLARTNVAALPRESPGPPGGAVFRVDLPPARAAAVTAPDAEAAAWFDAGSDWPARDRAAELVLRTLYRAFLREGPRALRRAGVIARTGAEELERQYERRRSRRGTEEAAVGGGSGVLVAFLDAREVLVPARPEYPLARLTVPAWTEAGVDFAFYRGVLCAARAGLRPENAGGADRLRAAEPVAAGALVRPAPAGLCGPPAWKAASIFAAARELERGLTRLPSSGAEVGQSAAVGFSREVGGRAGAAPSRLVLTLEGRARPGARFRVAGQLVRTDGNGCFRVECVVSGDIGRLTGGGRSLRFPHAVAGARNA